MIEVDSLEIEELNIFNKCNEAQLLHYFEPKEGVFIAESPKVIERALDSGYEPISMLLEKGHVQTECKDIIARLEKDYDIPIYLASPEMLINLTGYELTRGALCAMRRKPLREASMLCEGATKIVVLEDVVNPTNIGSIVRNAAALGVDAILFTKGCADPLYRRALRVSMGTALQVPWTFLNNEGSEYVDELKSWGFTTISMALVEDTLPISDKRLYKNEKTAIILGTEGDGLRKETISNSDYTVCIPMKNGVDSLNVASASAIAIWSLVNG